jgi:hypothetical protein
VRADALPEGTPLKGEVEDLIGRMEVVVDGLKVILEAEMSVARKIAPFNDDLPKQ